MVTKVNPRERDPSIAYRLVNAQFASVEQRLDAIEADYWTSANDGAGSGLDADLVHGVDGATIHHTGAGLQQQTVTIEDDAFAQITLPSDCFSNFILAVATGNDNTRGALIYVSTSQDKIGIIAESSVLPNYLVTADVVPTGTTGVDGKVTIYVEAGDLYIENRMGAQRIFALTFLANR